MFSDVDVGVGPVQSIISGCLFCLHFNGVFMKFSIVKTKFLDVVKCIDDVSFLLQ